VNQHLNQEVEKYVKRLAQLQSERDAWQQHARSLARKLADAKKDAASSGEPTDELTEPSLQPPEPEPYTPGQSLLRLEWPSINSDLCKVLLERGKTAGWLVDPTEVQKGPVLGSGAFGTTYRGTWRGADVAVKCVRISNADELNSFLQEVETLSQVRCTPLSDQHNASMTLHDAPAFCCCLLMLSQHLEHQQPAACTVKHHNSPVPGMPLLCATPGHGHPSQPEAHLHSRWPVQRSPCHAYCTHKRPPTPTLPPTPCPPHPYLLQVRHPHVVPFIGASLESPEHCWLISEYMPGGTLSAWLHSSVNALGHCSHSLHARLVKALEVAKAMLALESARPPIMHRDLKPTNVFLDAAGHVRIGDFGLAKRLTPQGRATLTGETGTYLYMSPEMIRHEIYGCKTDVWSWGVLLAEMVSCMMPYADTYLQPVQIALAVSEERLQPKFGNARGVPDDVLVLGHAALSFDPDLRPDFGTVVSEMSNALEVMQQQLAGQPKAGMLGSLQLPPLPAMWQKALARVPQLLPAPASGGTS
jgi:serine/threonine protein kinase